MVHFNATSFVRENTSFAGEARTDARFALSENRYASFLKNTTMSTRVAHTLSVDANDAFDDIDRLPMMCVDQPLDVHERQFVRRSASDSRFSRYRYRYRFHSPSSARNNLSKLAFTMNRSTRTTSNLDLSFTYFPLCKVYDVVTLLTMNQSFAHCTPSPQCTSRASKNVPKSFAGGVWILTSYVCVFFISVVDFSFVRLERSSSKSSRIRAQISGDRR